MQRSGISRRQFFYGALLAGAIPAGGFGSTPSLRRLGYKSPNEKLNIASIGAGGQAAVGINALARIGENIVALCDPDDKQAEGIYKTYEKVPKYKDFRRMLDREAGNIDAVLIATPDFMHGAQAMWCMERGKHVYVQKPMTRTVWESRKLMEAARKYKVATQMGNQGYCQDDTRICAEMIWSGAIGDITEVHAWTNRPIWPQGITRIPPAEDPPSTLDWDSWLGIAEWRPWTSGGDGYPNRYGYFYQPFNWRGFYDFGCGALGDMACHVLGAPNMALLLGQPSGVECVSQEGKNDLTFPVRSTIRFDFPARRNMPPVTVYWHDGAKGLPASVWPKDLPREERMGDLAPGMTIPGEAPPARIVRPGPPAPPLDPADPAGAAAAAKAGQETNSSNSGVLYIGAKGYMTTGEYGGSPRILPMSRMADYRYPPQVLPRSPETYSDWVRACKGGDPAASNFDVAAPFTEWILLGVVALRFEGALEWDSVKMRVPNNPAAARFLKPAFRKGWKFS